MRVADSLFWAGKTATLATALGLLCGYAGQLAWPLELFVNFRLQYGLLFCGCVLCLLAARRFRWALLAVVGAAFCMLSVVAYTGSPWPDSSTRDTDSSSRPASFRLVTFNVWFRNQDLRRVATYLEQIGADAVILLELSPENALRLQALLPSYQFAQIDPQPHGAVIFSRWPLAEQQFWFLCSQCTRIARAKLDWRGQQITLLGAHLHWPIGGPAAALRRAELQALGKLMRSRQGPTLLGGDFNLTPWSRYFSDFLAGSALADCTRGHGWRPTWPQQLASLGIRIDHCFASQDWQTAAATVGPRLGSDHLPNVVDLRLRVSR